MNFFAKFINFSLVGYVFEAYDQTFKRKVALKRIEKVGDQLSREFEILLDIKDCDHVVKIVVIFFNFFESFFHFL